MRNLIRPVSYREADLGSVGTSWLRLLTLATLAQRFPAEFPQQRWCFRRWPGFGFQRGAAALSEHQRRVLPQWVRERPSAAPVLPVSESRPPDVSVIIPCYNLGRYLHEAVESALRQAPTALEVIVVDDGSTDEFTRLLLDQLPWPRVQLLKQANRGVAAARNHGIRQSEGRYLCCLDADDRIRPDFFARAVAILDEQPAVGVVSGHTQWFDEREQCYRSEHCELPDLLAVNHVVEPAVFRRQAWEKAGGYSETFPVAGVEDWDLWLRFVELGYRVAVIPEVVWEYRIRPHNMSTHMFRTENWERLMRELARRHEAIYRQHASEFAGKTGASWARLRDWIEDRERLAAARGRHAGNWQRIAGELQRTAQQQETEITRLQTEAGEHDRMMRQQEAEITRLQARGRTLVGHLVCTLRRAVNPTRRVRPPPLDQRMTVVRQPAARSRV